MKNYWMFIINQENWEIVKKTNIVGSKYINKVKSITKNYIIVVYIIKPLCSIVGMFGVVENYTDSKSLFKGGLYPYRLKLTPIKVLKNPVNIKTLINRLIFIKNKKKWNGHFFGVKGVRKLVKKDFETIKEVINANK